MPAAQVVIASDTAADTVRVLVVDRRRLIAEALGGLLAAHPGLEVVGAIGPDDVRDAIADAQPDLLLLGVGSELADATEVLGHVHAARERPTIVIVTDRLERDLVRLVLEQRLGGLVLATMPAPDILGCLAQVGQGHCVLPAGWQSALDPAPEDPLDALSARQAEVLELLSAGCSYEEIAARLGISLNTVKFHLRSIFTRLGVHNRVAAVHRLTHAR